MALDVSDHPTETFDLLDDYINWSELGAPINDGACSTEPAFSSENAETSRGSSSKSGSTPAEDIFTLPRDHHPIQSRQEQFIQEDTSEPMRGLPHSIGSCCHMPRNCDTLGEDFLSNIEWDSAAQPDNYTLDQAWPAGVCFSNNVSGTLDMTWGYDHNMPDAAATQGPWSADEPQSPVYLLSQDVTARRQESHHSIEDLNVPRYVGTYPSAATGSRSAVKHPGTTGEGSPQDSKTLDLGFDPLVDFQSSFAPYLRMPISIGDFDANDVSKTQAGSISSPLNAVGTTPCPVNSVSGTSRLVRTPQSSSSRSKNSYKSLVNTSRNSAIRSKHRERLPIMPAPVKSYLGAPQASTNMEDGNLQLVYGPQRLTPKRSDRRRLTDTGKKEMREVREMRPCIVCLVKKGKCDTNKICEACQRMALAKNTKLNTKHICIREGLLDFRQEILNFYGIESRLCMLPTKEDLKIPWRTIMIGQRVKISGADTAFFPQKAQLVVPTRKYETCKMDDNLVYSGRAPRSAHARYAIDPEGFPTASQLDTWGKNCLLEHCHLPDSRRYIIMDMFLISYLKAMPHFRHRDLVNLTVSLVSLSTWVLESHPMIDVTNIDIPGQLVFGIQDSRIESRVSQVARTQLRLIATKRIEEIEKEFFFKFDSLVRTRRLDPQSTLIVGLCLRRISLLYRVSFKRYQQFALDSDDSNIDQRGKNSKSMYEVLSMGYSLVYIGAKSPYSRKWRVEDCLDAFGNDKELSDHFLEVVRHDRLYCEGNREDEDDLHLNTLFVDRKEGGGPRAWK